MPSLHTLFFLTELAAPPSQPQIAVLDDAVGEPSADVECPDLASADW